MTHLARHVLPQLDKFVSELSCHIREQRVQPLKQNLDLTLLLGLCLLIILAAFLITVAVLGRGWRRGCFGCRGVR